MVTAARGAWAREPHTKVIRGIQSLTAIPSPFAISATSDFHSTPLEFEPHEHPLHELVWVRGGTMTVRLQDRVITVPEGHGLWIPAHTIHSGRTTAQVALCTASFDPTRAPLTFPEVLQVVVTPLLAELLVRLERTDLTTEARVRTEAVVFDAIEPAPSHLTLRIPHIGRISPIVEALDADPLDERTFGEWATLIGASERTAARLFRAHTGLSFLQWRQTLRIHYALTLLGEGRAVQEVSVLLGYSQPSTFIATFKRVMGTTPGAYSSQLAETL